jgi:hypothetical protein
MGGPGDRDRVVDAGLEVHQIAIQLIRLGDKVRRLLGSRVGRQGGSG